MIAALVIAATITGHIPAALGAPRRIVWLAADGSLQVPCELATTSTWRCDEAPGDGRGLVALSGVDAVAHQCVAVCGTTSDPVVHKWARLLVVEPGGVAPDALRGLRM